MIKKEKKQCELKIKKVSNLIRELAKWEAEYMGYMTIKKYYNDCFNMIYCYESDLEFFESFVRTFLNEYSGKIKVYEYMEEKFGTEYYEEFVTRRESRGKDD